MPAARPQAEDEVQDDHGHGQHAVGILEPHERLGELDLVDVLVAAEDLLDQLANEGTPPAEHEDGVLLAHVQALHESGIVGGDQPEVQARHHAADEDHGHHADTGGGHHGHQGGGDEEHQVHRECQAPELGHPGQDAVEHEADDEHQGDGGAVGRHGRRVGGPGVLDDALGVEGLIDAVDERGHGGAHHGGPRGDDHVAEHGLQGGQDRVRHLAALQDTSQEGHDAEDDGSVAEYLRQDLRE